MEIQSQFTEVQGVRIHYLSAGEGGTPVLLLHGGGIDSARLSWQTVIEALAPHCRVFALDWPGYGESGWSEAQPSVDYYISVLEGFRQKLGIEEAHLVGISLGGAIALGYALRHPEVVKKLVLVASYGLQRTAPLHKLSFLLVRLPLFHTVVWSVLRRSRFLVRRSLQGIFGDPRRVTESLVEEVWMELQKPNAGKAFSLFQKNEAQWDGLRTVYLDELPKLHVPTLIVHGARDRLVPLAWAQEAHKRINGSRLHIIPDCGHWLQREKPEEFNRVVLPFLLG